MQRTSTCLAKLDRIEEIFRTRVADTPPVVFEILSGQRRRLEEAREACGDYVSPLHFVQAGQVE